MSLWHGVHTARRKMKLMIPTAEILFILYLYLYIIYYIIIFFFRRGDSGTFERYLFSVEIMDKYGNEKTRIL